MNSQLIYVSVRGQESISNNIYIRLITRDRKTRDKTIYISKLDFIDSLKLEPEDALYNSTNAVLLVSLNEIVQ